LEHRFFNRLGRVLWVGLVILVVLLAVYVSGGRLLAANVSAYRTAILRELNARLPVTLEARSLGSEWHSFTPVIVLKDLRLRVPDNSRPPLELSQGRIGVDVFNSLRTGTLQVTHLVLGGLSLRGELSSGGMLKLSGLGESSGESTGPLREFLLNVEQVELRDNQLLLTMPSGEVRALGLDLQLSREGSERRVEASLTSTAGARISVIAQGLGDPFRPGQFTGKVYLHAQTPDLGAMQAMFADRTPAVWADGNADLELWLDWDKGHSAATARFQGSDLVATARDSAWQVPLQQVGFEARLLLRDDGWTGFVKNLRLVDGEGDVTLPRLQVDSRGNSLQLRAVAVPLAPVNSLLLKQEAVPERLREVFSRLQPQGELSLLQVTIGDVDRFDATWAVAANFAGVAVDSWHGAPGVRGAAGYARLAPGSGSVVLDSPGLSLEFPTVYRQSLHYDDMYGSLALDWTSDTFRLGSGLLTTQGEEGTAKVLFGLDIPLQPSDTGIEMDLLVGLQDSRSEHRGKYIPYILNEKLRSWLASSIGEGRIQQGAFLWRGSLKPGAEALRTVQLAFNVADTQLSYDPRWPPVTVEDGVVLIDDTAVSVWAGRARLFESTARQLSVETRVDGAGQITLDLRGSVHGPAADGFRVLNESPLADVVGSKFGGWTAAGSLDTDLRLHLNLSDAAAAPRVAVTTQWHDVDLLVAPGNLPIEEVNGEFAYSTTGGFSSSALAGKLWGSDVSASLRQQFAAGTTAYDPTSTVVHVGLATEVDMADLQRWLQLETLGFASGRTAAAVDIELAPGGIPALTVTSDLQGVSLDLPQPWHKEAPSPLPFRLQMPLQAGDIPLQLELAEQLRIHLELADGTVRGGALGIAAMPAPVQAGELHVTGRAPLVHVDQWLDFVGRYYGGDALPTLAAAAGSDVDAEVPAATAAAPSALPMRLFIDDLHADTLVVLQQPLNDLTLDLAQEPDQWQLSLDADWVTADLSISRTDQPWRLDVARLDLDQLPDFEPAGAGSADSAFGTGQPASWKLPLVQVAVADLYRSGKRLGELKFDLSGQDQVIAADNITGELANLQFRPEAPGQLLWYRGETPYCEVQAGLSFADLGQTLEYFDYQRIVETEHGELDLQLRWPGAPQDFSLAQGAGSMLVRIGAGSFLEASAGATGALHVVSILNLADIVRRLSLTTMFESGIPFDSVGGKVELDDGILKVARMDVSGGSSFQFSGESDVQARTIAGKLVATLPVASNLPWIAAFAASLPVAAGVYVISQVFDKQMDRLSSAVYTIGGTWDDPEVNFDRLFDDTPRDTTPSAGAVQSTSP